MLHNTLKMIKLVIPAEAETGNAGEQPVRNSPVNVNSGGLAPAGLRFYTIYITMPKKTQKIFSNYSNLFFGFCPFHAGAVQFFGYIDSPTNSVSECP